MYFPSKCPHCGKDNVENMICRQPERANGSQRRCVEWHACIHCGEPIFLFKEELWHEGVFVCDRILHYFPHSHIVTDYPQKVQELSPKAFEIYRQTTEAKEAGLESLIGAGLRMALEQLIWDYLLNVKEKTSDEIEDLKLSERINLMNVGFYTKVCMRLVRLFGNDTVHVIKTLDFSNDEAMEAYKTLCNLIDSEITILQNNERLPS